MKNKEGVTLVIELDAEEARVFRKIAKTGDPVLFEGIAKSLLSGATEVVSPAEVLQDIELLHELSEYALRGDLPARQDWADELSFTRAQLERQAVKDAMGSWAVYFGSNIQELYDNRHTSDLNQTSWYASHTVTVGLLQSLRNVIGQKL